MIAAVRGRGIIIEARGLKARMADLARQQRIAMAVDMVLLAYTARIITPTLIRRIRNRWSYGSR
jgi:hypothetical protein